MERKDYDLPFLLRYENVAWYEDKKVRILDRRAYPTEIKFVECFSYEEVAKAIYDMVTQSAGPYTACSMGMVLAASQVENESEKKQIEFLTKASEVISNSRPTTANRYRLITVRCLEVAKNALKNGKDVKEAIFEDAIASLNRRYTIMEEVSKYLVSLIPNNSSVLTQCFGETIIGMMCRTAKKVNKTFKAYCLETRPYFQGARLTSSCFFDSGIDVTVITDNMTAYVMNNGYVDIFTSAADSITRDGHIANKIGTFQAAILSEKFNIPYYVTGIPDKDKLKGEDIVIEERDPSLVLSYRGIKNTLDGVKGIYPSFDITPPRLISAIVTDKGIYSPYNLEEYFSSDVKDFY